MKQSVIGEIYSSLSKAELKKLNKFITTSHWSRSETVVQCHQCLADYSAKDKLEYLDKEKLFLATYPSEDYNDNKLRFTMNRLLDAIKEFVLLEENEKKNIHTEKIWMDFILNKKLKKNILLNIENRVEPKEALNKFIYQYNKSVLNGQFNFIKDATVEEKYNSLIEMAKSADTFADFEFLRQYSLLITFANVYKSSDLQIAESRYRELRKKQEYENSPEFQIYFLIIELLINPNEDTYYKLKKFLFINSSKWDVSYNIICINYLINYSTGQINKGNIQYIDEQFEIYNFCETNGFYNSIDFLTTTRINNIVHIFLRKKEFDKAEKFIEQYVNMLPRDILISCRHFNLARIRFEKKMYKESLRELLQVDFGKNIAYSINSKYLILKNYYELKETDALYSLLTSFKEYIKKNKIISQVHIINTLNFIKMVDKIYKVTNKNILKLEKELNQSSMIAEKAWLVEKLYEKKNLN